MVAFAYAYFEEVYWPLRTVSVFYFLRFLVRATAGISGARWVC